MATKLPERVEIGPLVFSITDGETEHLRAVQDNDGAIWGKIHYPKGEIILDPNQSPSHKRLALLHECLHGVWHLSDRAHESDEDIIRQICAPLLDMLRRNPDLVAYLLSED